MVRLTSPWRETLSEADLDEYPIWVWDDGNDGYLPLSEPSYEYGTLFIKAEFRTGGFTFKGLLVGSHSFYAFSIFINGQKFFFNVNLPKLAKKEVKKIISCLNCNKFDFFPIYYKSNISLEVGKEISGFISIKE